MFGYMGKILEVDLSSQSIKDIPLNEKDLKPFVGGSGLACKIMLDRLGTAIGGIDPLSPENLLIFMTGPLTGTRVPNSGRFEVCAKSPLTNIWGEANCGGRFGPYLKFAGYLWGSIQEKNIKKEGFVILKAPLSSSALSLLP